MRRSLVEVHYTKKRQEIYHQKLMANGRFHRIWPEDEPEGFFLRLASAIGYEPSAGRGIFIMFDVILYQPEIPPNTGNIIRLCANTGATLHLVKPLGFSLGDRQLLRAGLDYREFATVRVYNGWDECGEHFTDRRLFAFSTKGTQRYDLVEYARDDVFLFGPESRGLPDEVLEAVAESRRIRLPMMPESRSLNLSNAVAVVVYEAWRQVGFGRSG